jgi:TPR repeat protein
MQKLGKLWLPVLLMGFACSYAQSSLGQGVSASNGPSDASTSRTLTPAHSDKLDKSELIVRGLKSLAEQGDAKAQWLLGYRYEHGDGVPQDYTLAANLYRKAADQGVAFAQIRLGLLYEKGIGIEQDYVVATSWYRKAADQGDSYGQWMLGSMYQGGRGVERNYVMAIHWYRKAAEQGDVYAQASLGGMYEFGLGVPQDFVQAHMWFNLSASQGGAGAALFRDELANRMTAAQVAEAQKLAREWTPNKR